MHLFVLTALKVYIITYIINNYTNLKKCLVSNSLYFVQVVYVILCG